MAEILFVGKKSVGHHVPEIAGKDVDFTGEVTTIEQAKALIMKDDTYTTVIIDLSTITTDYVRIADECRNMSLASKARFIFYYLGKPERTELVSALVERGFSYFVLSSYAVQQNEQLKMCLNGMATVSPPPPPPEEAETPEETEQENAKTLSVSLMGCCNRIGTTTQAIQIIKFLQLMGYKACYVEANEDGFAELIGNTYESSVTDEETKCVTYDNVDLYGDPTQIGVIKSKGYNYTVWDYGVFDGSTAKTMAFLDKDLPIVVGGISPVELALMNPILQSPIMASNCSYIFSFVHPNDEKEVMELMESKADSTFFARYTPDPFGYTSATNDLYGAILKINKTPHQNKIKKHSFFGKKRK